MHISLYALEDCVVALGELLYIHIIKYPIRMNKIIIMVCCMCQILVYYYYIII